MNSPQRNSMSFPTASVPPLTPLRANFDLDWNGHGVWTLETPVACWSCAAEVTHAESRCTGMDVFLAACPACGEVLGTVVNS